MDRTDVPRGGHCRPKRPTRLPTGRHHRCWTLFRLQQLLTSFLQQVRRTRGEKPRVWTRIKLPRPGVPARGHHRPNEPRTSVPRREHCRPKCPTTLPKGWRHRFLTICRAQLEWILVFSANERRGPEARNGRFGFASCSQGLVFPDKDIEALIQTRLLTLLSNTPQTKWFCSGSPHPIFYHVPFVVCRGRRATFVRGAVYDGRKVQYFSRPSSSGAHNVVA